MKNKNNGFQDRHLTSSNYHTTLTFSYDSLGSVTSVHDSRLDKTINYEYDRNGNRTKMTGPEVGITTYTYNALNLIDTITNPAGKLFDFSYDKLGRRKSLAYPNGLNISYSYDIASRITDLLTQNSAPSTLNSNIYTYDDIGNRLTNTDLTGEHTYSYDNLYQLTEAIHPTPTAGTEGFTYDRTGNRKTAALSGQPSAISYTYTNGNRIETQGEVTYEHDNNGNITGMTDTSGTTTYEYDSDNMLTKVTMPNSTVAEQKRFRGHPIIPCQEKY